MKCPVCETTDLQMTERQDVEIDYCPKCRGVWLDRGELDKIIDRVAAAQPAAPGPAAPPVADPPRDPSPYPAQPPVPPATYQQPWAGQPPYPAGYRGKDDSDYNFRYPGAHGHHRRKKGFLGELFDFD